MDKMDSKTMDIVAENVGKLKELFPEAFTEDGTTKDTKGTKKIDFEVLKELLGEYVTDKDERYSFTWNGKSKARMIAQTPSTGTLRPCKEESVDWDTTQNIFIEGDNLEVLKLLQKSYHKKVKMIYIDPPYNTGKDFVYKDNFKDNIKNYKEITGQVDGEGRNLSNNPETSGRYHTDWLNMMYPRLKLARNLLKDDGFFIISIDDAEYDNLKKCTDEMFGDENYLATLIWDKNRKNDAKYFSVGHEYMLVYCKSSNHLLEQNTILREPKDGIDEVREYFKHIQKTHGENYAAIQSDWRKYFNDLSSDDPKKVLGRFSKIDSKGPFRDDGNISWPGGGGPKYDVVHPETGKNCKIPDGGWRYSTPKRFWEEVESGKVVFGPDETTLPRQCRYLFESEDQVMRSVHYSYAQTTTMKFNEIMGQGIFQNPKSYSDIQRMVRYLTSKNDIIVDFFAGSATTAHAVMQLNAEDGGNRKFIMVQLPESTGEKSEAFKAGYKTIAEISKERIRRAAAKIKEELATTEKKKKENSLFGEADPSVSSVSSVVKKLDLGFKVFKLDSTNIKPWEVDFDLTERTLEDFISNIKPDRREEDVLYEILLKYGLDLTLPISERTIAGKKVFDIGMGALIICLADSISLEVVR
jgi:adenine-specific DNA-methyltransferase